MRPPRIVTNWTPIVFTTSLALPSEFWALAKLSEDSAHPYGQLDTIIRLLDPNPNPPGEEKPIGAQALFSERLPPSDYPAKGTRFPFYSGAAEFLGTGEVL